jgi:hypothetical protein
MAQRPSEEASAYTRAPSSIDQLLLTSEPARIGWFGLTGDAVARGRRGAAQRFWGADRRQNGKRELHLRPTCVARLVVKLIRLLFWTES